MNAWEILGIEPTKDKKGIISELGDINIFDDIRTI